MNNEIKVRLSWDSEDEGRTLVEAFRSISNAGFTPLNPELHTSPQGNFLVANLVWLGDVDMRDSAEALLREVLHAD